METKKKVVNHIPISKTKCGIKCSCGFIHPVDESGKMLTGFLAGCNCGRIHSIRWDEDGKPHVDTGYY